MTKNKFLLLTFLLIFSTNLSSNLAAQESSSAAEIANEDDNSKLTLDKVDSSRFYNKAALQILNKTTAKTIISEINIGGSADFGQLSIKVDRCWQAPLDQKPDSRILLEIFETKADGEKKRIFFGWMISSSPSISSLEHPIYDVTALSCKK